MQLKKLRFLPLPLKKKKRRKKKRANAKQVIQSHLMRKFWKAEGCTMYMFIVITQVELCLFLFRQFTCGVPEIQILRTHCRILSRIMLLTRRIKKEYHLKKFKDCKSSN
jgi:hypothetical protein